MVAVPGMLRRGSTKENGKENVENFPSKVGDAPQAKKPLASSLKEPVPDAAPSSSTWSLATADTEHVCLQEWSFAFNGSRPLQLTGKVYNPALRTEVGFEDGNALCALMPHPCAPWCVIPMCHDLLLAGDLLEYTSQIVSCNGRTATTKSGTAYTLGKPAANFDQLRKQLWICSRTGRLGRDDGSSVPPLDEDNPLLGIKLGEVVAAAPVRLPKVAGWSHQSGVAVRAQASSRTPVHPRSALLLLSVCGVLTCRVCPLSPDRAAPQ